MSWRWDFFINVPIGVLLFLGGVASIRESPVGPPPEAGRPGRCHRHPRTAGLHLRRHGWRTRRLGRPSDVGALLFAAVMFVAFHVIELRTSEPLAPVRILHANTVKRGNPGGLATFSMESALSFLLTLYMQQVLGLTPFQTGLMFGFLGLGAFIGGTVAPRIIGRTGAKGALVLGLLIQAVMTGVLFWLGDDMTVSITAILVTTFIGGFGRVLAIVAYTVTATSGVPDHEQGLVTGLATMTQQIGFTIGIPIMSAVAATRYGSLTDGVASVEGVLEGTPRSACSSTASSCSRSPC
ncbi:MFS transporter [Thermobifida alba]|uniref:MFS transporter n=1 Tax=Thermobifida alba TaxID=53522 RepID=UPI003CD0B6D7